MKEMRRSIWLSAPYIFICFFFYHIDKLISIICRSSLLQFIFVSVLLICIGVCTIVILAFSIRDLYFIVRSYKEIYIQKLYPVAIYWVALIIGFCGPLRISSECFESRKIYSGYLKGTVSHLVLTLRKNSRFEINDSGMGMSEYSYGAWTKRGDTIFLKHDHPPRVVKPISFDTLLVIDDRLNPINNKRDSTGMYYYRQFILTTRPD